MKGVRYLRFVVTLKPERIENLGIPPYPLEVVLGYKKGEKMPKKRHWEFKYYYIDAYDSDYAEKWKIRRRPVPTEYIHMIRYVGCKTKTVTKDKEFFAHFTEEQLATDPFAKRKNNNGMTMITNLDEKLPPLQERKWNWNK